MEIYKQRQMDRLDTNLQMIKDKIDELVRSEPFDLECQCDANAINAVIEETKGEIDRIGQRVSNQMHDGTAWSMHSGYNGQGTARMF